ncbi:MAG: TIM barrel protein, partial [Actinomycetia bacterium]|nr:TIM barrel protein [Actinomycetes bacterium]
DAGVRLAGLNFFAGDLAGPDCGVLSLPKRSQEFRDSVAAAVAIGEELGVTGFNALYGNRVAGISPEDQDDLARENLGLAADAAARIGGCVLVEAVSGPKPYPLRTAGDSARVVEEVRSDGHPSIGVLLDLYHLAANGDDLDAAIEAYAPVTAHVQIADHPGRGEPGSGSLDLARHLAALEARGYPGWTALEYTPTAGTEASLAWMEDQR